MNQPHNSETDCLCNSNSEQTKQSKKIQKLAKQQKYKICLKINHYIQPFNHYIQPFNLYLILFNHYIQPFNHVSHLLYVNHV